MRRSGKGEEWVQFSLEWKNLGGAFSKAEATAALKKLGIPFRLCGTPYVGHYGLQVPKRFDKKVEKLFFGRGGQRVYNVLYDEMGRKRN